MMIGFWIMSVIVVFIAIYIYKRDTVEQNEQKSRGLIYKSNEVRYLGGLPDITGDKNASIEVWRDRIYIDFHSINYDNMSINTRDIINAEIKTEQQIQSEVSVGKLLLVGVLAFGMKNKKTITNNYLTLNYNNYGEERILIFESKWIEELTREIRQIINKNV